MRLAFIVSVRRNPLVKVFASRTLLVLHVAGEMPFLPGLQLRQARSWVLENRRLLHLEVDYDMAYCLFGLRDGPACGVHEMPLLRYHKQWWRITIPPAHRPRDALQPPVLLAAFRLASAAIDPIPTYRQRLRDPVTAALHAAHAVGCSFKSANAFA